MPPNLPRAFLARRPAPTTVRELLVRADALTGHAIAEIATALNTPLPPDPRRAKGFIGQLVEAALGADPDAGDGPDFPHLGVELKTVPVNNRDEPVESTFVCSITMADADRVEWESSRARRRLAQVLWIPVTAAAVAPLAERRLGAAVLWQPSATQEALLRADWEELMGEIGAGNADRLTAHVGRVLQVRPKAASSQVRTLGIAEDGLQRLLPLGFYLRARFTREVLTRP